MPIPNVGRFLLGSGKLRGFYEDHRSFEGWVLGRSLLLLSNGHQVLAGGVAEIAKFADNHRQGRAIKFLANVIDESDQVLAILISFVGRRKNIVPAPEPDKS